MKNDATAFRFHFAEGQPEQIPARALMDVISAAERTFELVAGRFSKSPPIARLHHVASPRQQCIEFLFQPQLTIGFDPAHLATLLPQTSADQIARRFAEARDWAEFLWGVVFGKPLWDLFGRPKGSQSGGRAVVEDALEISIAETLANNPKVTQQLNLLVGAALRSGARRLEVQVRDRAPVDVAIEDPTKKAFLIGIGKEGGLRVDLSARQQIIRLSREQISVQHKGSEFPAFLGRIKEKPAIFIWKSRAEMPRGKAQASVQIAKPELSDLAILDELPAEFLQAEGFFLVESAASWM